MNLLLKEHQINGVLYLFLITNELNKNSVIQNNCQDSKAYNTNFYSLDDIIAVRIRVNSKETTDFKIWTPNTLKEYIKKVFALNTELKNGPKFRKDYFDELIIKTKSIESSK